MPTGHSGEPPRTRSSRRLRRGACPESGKDHRRRHPRRTRRRAPLRRNDDVLGDDPTSASASCWSERVTPRVDASQYSHFSRVCGQGRTRTGACRGRREACFSTHPFAVDDHRRARCSRRVRRDNRKSADCLWRKMVTMSADQYQSGRPKLARKPPPSQ
jgi:hypothetical protein